MKLEDQLAAIGQLDLAGLRTEWGRRYGAPPKLRSVDLIRQMLAWRIQIAALGGPDANTRRLIRGGASRREALLAPGTILTREWKGARHQVEVAEKGYIHEGRRWASLSEVARSITGTRWNGPRFFGLRDAA